MQRTKEEIAALRAAMSPAEWDSLAMWGLEPGGANEERHAAAVEEFDRAQAAKRDHYTPLVKLFGKNSDYRASAKLHRTNPEEWRRLRGLAESAGLLAPFAGRSGVMR